MSIASLFYINPDTASFLIIHTSQNLKIMLTFSLKLKTLEFFLESPFNTTFLFNLCFYRERYLGKRLLVYVLLPWTVHLHVIKRLRLYKLIVHHKVLKSCLAALSINSTWWYIAVKWLLAYIILCISYAPLFCCRLRVPFHLVNPLQLTLKTHPQKRTTTSISKPWKMALPEKKVWNKVQYLSDARMWKVHLQHYTL